MIALGTPVSYHHRAAVARFGPPEAKQKTWALREGCRKGEYVNPVFLDGQFLADAFADRPAIAGRGSRLINKTVMVWPDEGSGVVVGRVKRGRGTSEPSHYSTSYEGGEEFEPGWFNSHEWFWLYAIRHRLDGLDYILCPEWAVAPIHTGTL